MDWIRPQVQPNTQQMVSEGFISEWTALNADTMDGQTGGILNVELFSLTGNKTEDMYNFRFIVFSGIGKNRLFLGCWC